ncbi:predicted protein [Uncinocarpus reesii 1704]|uniref:Uncharacterized protein n=1 Tax=Uncinocarpus reesii (strain UAMH 1704) TaxID=336963 RepID=C4JID0_UNCRE|nr:uncharacterized protein UREG_02876 [Uncinocarpus reesii 1704]EEP78027.1 predicted protein [Uncinocarpus reesii 1704]
MKAAGEPERQEAADEGLPRIGMGGRDRISKDKAPAKAKRDWIPSWVYFRVVGHISLGAAEEQEDEVEVLTPANRMPDWGYFPVTGWSSGVAGALSLQRPPRGFLFPNIPVTKINPGCYAPHTPVNMVEAIDSANLEI